MTDPKLDRFVMDDTTGAVDFDELAAFEATIDPVVKAEAERKAAEILGKTEPAAA